MIKQMKLIKKLKKYKTWKIKCQIHWYLWHCTEIEKLQTGPMARISNGMKYFQYLRIEYYVFCVCERLMKNLPYKLDIHLFKNAARICSFAHR